MEKEILTFEYERETKNTIRFKELTQFDPPMVGTLYIQKSALGDKPPKKLTVTVEDGSNGGA